MFQCLEESLR